MLKQILISIVFLCMTIGATAQANEQYFSYEWPVGYIQYDPIKHEIPRGTKEVKYKVSIGKKTPKLSARQYNEQGKITKIYPINDTKNKRESKEITYDENQHVSMVTISKKGKITHTYKYETAANNKPLSQEKIKDNKTVYKNVWSYNTDGNVTEVTSYGKNGEIKNKSVTEYYDKYQKSKTTLYNKKGKVKKTWTYACKEEGEIQANKKNETRVCIRKDISGDVLTNVYQNFDEKGQIVKNVYKYHLPDTSLMEYSCYNRKDELTHKILYAGSFDKMLSNTVYYKKGKIWSERQYEYKNGLLVSDTYSYKGKLKGKQVHVYNEQGFVTNVTWYNKEKVGSEVLIEYVQ